MKDTGGIWFGAILIAVGVVLLLDNMYIIDFSEILHTYWPVVFILFGLSLLFRRSSPRTATSSERINGASATVYPSSDTNQLSASMVFGDYTVAVQSKAFAGGTVSTTFGDIDIDLLNAGLAEGEHWLKLDGIFGDTTLHYPKDMAVAVYANTTFGDVRVNERQRDGVSPTLDFTSPNFHLASRRLRVSISRVFGDVTVQCS